MKNIFNIAKTYLDCPVCGENLNIYDATSGFKKAFEFSHEKYSYNSHFRYYSSCEFDQVNFNTQNITVILRKNFYSKEKYFLYIKYLTLGETFHKEYFNEEHLLFTIFEYDESWLEKIKNISNTMQLC